MGKKNIPRRDASTSNINVNPTEKYPTHTPTMNDQQKKPEINARIKEEKKKTETNTTIVDFPDHAIAPIGFIKCRIEGKEEATMLDSGSQTSIMLKSFAKKKGIKMTKSNLEINGHDGKVTNRGAWIAEATIQVAGRKRKHTFAVVDNTRTRCHSWT